MLCRPPNCSKKARDALERARQQVILSARCRVRERSQASEAVHEIKAMLGLGYRNRRICSEFVNWANKWAREDSEGMPVFSRINRKWQWFAHGELEVWGGHSLFVGAA